MSEYYVVWSVYDHAQETSTVICRGIVYETQGVKSAKQKASDLIPKVVKRHNDSEAYPEGIGSGEVEVTVTSMADWLQKLRTTVDELEAIIVGEDDDV